MVDTTIYKLDLVDTTQEFWISVGELEQGLCESSEVYSRPPLPNCVANVLGLGEKHDRNGGNLMYTSRVERTKILAFF